MHCTELHCTVQQCTELSCTVQQWAALNCIVEHSAAVQCSELGSLHCTVHCLFPVCKGLHLSPVSDRINGVSDFTSCFNCFQSANRADMLVEISDISWYQLSVGSGKSRTKELYSYGSRRAAVQFNKVSYFVSCLPTCYFVRKSVVYS